MSVNLLSGKISDPICCLPKLQVLQLYNNSLTGEIPTILGDPSTIIALDKSENRLSGELSPDICRGGKLLYLLAFSNQLTGEIPHSYCNYASLICFQISNNQLVGLIPPAIIGLPGANIIDLAFN
uniref:Receptor protein-tyrosine kinase n=1 Tax=Opuntia streptacantha TaxID=393608 RepID=A0A7C8ZFQ3_OPUST